MRNKVSLTLNIVFLVMMILFFLDRGGIPEIKLEWLRKFVYLGVFAAPLLLIADLFLLRNWSHRIFSTVFLGLFSLLIYKNSLRLLFASSPYVTQTILYQDVNNSSHKIEFQMRDIGALGYDRRDVEVYYITNAFMIVYPVPSDVLKNKVWKRVDINVDNMELGTEDDR